MSKNQNFRHYLLRECQKIQPQQFSPVSLMLLLLLPLLLPLLPQVVVVVGCCFYCCCCSEWGLSRNWEK